MNSEVKLQSGSGLIKKNSKDILARRIFEAIVKSLDHPTFMDQILRTLNGSRCINLATFELNSYTYSCLPEYAISNSELLAVTPLELEAQVYTHNYYYKIRRGPLAGWCLKTKYLGSGLCVNRVSYFTLAKVAPFWRHFLVLK